MNRILECRKASGLSQKQVALTLGVAAPSVSEWENGKTTPTCENLIALAQLFDVTTDRLLGIEKAAQQEPDGQVDEFIRRASQLTPENQRKALSYMEFLYEREQPARQAPHDAQPVTAP